MTYYFMNHVTASPVLTAKISALTSKKFQDSNMKIPWDVGMEYPYRGFN